MRHEKSIFSPKEERERARVAELRRNMQAAVAAAGEAMLAEVKANVALRVNRYREALPVHTRNLFDTLSYEDQKRVALYTVDRGDDTQRDYDDEREHGWSV
jgi:hypothetical protein